MTEQDEQKQRDRWKALGVRTDIPHPARVYDYMLGGKDNISQVVSVVPYSGLAVTIQALQANYSKIASLAVRHLSCTCLGANVRFLRRGCLTLLTGNARLAWGFTGAVLAFGAVWPSRSRAGGAGVRG